MFAGTLIEDLMATVERAEQYPCKHQGAELQSAQSWHGMAAYEFAQAANNLLGVA
jgi:hypothetical protein